MYMLDFQDPNLHTRVRPFSRFRHKKEKNHFNLFLLVFSAVVVSFKQFPPIAISSNSATSPKPHPFRSLSYVYRNRVLLRYRLLHLVDIERDMRVQLQVLVFGGMDLVLDVVFQVGHLVRTQPH